MKNDYNAETKKRRNIFTACFSTADGRKVKKELEDIRNSPAFHADPYQHAVNEGMRLMCIEILNQIKEDENNE